MKYSRKRAEQAARNALEAVARKHGVSAETVYLEIEIAIAAARENIDPNMRKFWSSVPRKGDTPTLEEVIVYIAGTGHDILH